MIGHSSLRVPTFNTTGSTASSAALNSPRSSQQHTCSPARRSAEPRHGAIADPGATIVADSVSVETLYFFESARSETALGDGFVRKNPPDITALQPALVTASLDTAPVALALDQLGDDAGFGTSNELRLGVGAPAHHPDAAVDDDVALGRHHAVEDPAAGV